VTPRVPSASGARLAGDDYQHLYTWLQALTLLRENPCTERIAMEVRDAGNVDDLAVYRRGAPNLYHQIKFVVDHRQHFTHEWFTTAPTGGPKRTPLQRFCESFRNLSAIDAPAELVLITNRPEDRDDPVLKLISGRHARLTPRLTAVAPNSRAGHVRAAWAEHLGITEDELLEILDHLTIRAGGESFATMRETCGWAMEAVGLRGDPDAVDIGMNEMRRLIADGCDELDQDRLREIIAAKRLSNGGSRATLLVQAIDRDPWPDAATASVDWVDLFRGDTPHARRQLHDPSLWAERLQPELHAAAETIKRQGYSSVLVRGALRLSTWFLCGLEFSDLARFTIALPTRDGIWTTDAEREPFGIVTHSANINRGAELAVGISVTGNISKAAESYIKRAGLPVKSLLSVAPASGVGDAVLSSPGAAKTWARATLDVIRHAAEEHDGAVHLFMYAPASAALFLGHIWNRVPDAQLYEDVVRGGYAPTYVVRG
jgi:hypothetical protein